ncbi:hypothetical protein [Terasakiella sp. SH-1]|uniref:hypothetical protein n=1 Tax=Terasakiella sp. SH-1 TaxID=2560057 RepID=UPI0010749C47|nr:hypothetical protein [Terasakiella sp. SH-1]
MDPFTIFMTVATMAQSMMAARKQQQAQQRAAQQAADQQAKEQWEAYERAEKERKDQLKKAVAKKRARMGASGFSAADGSAGAIIQGLRTDEAEKTHQQYSDAQENINQTISSLHTDLLKESDQRKRAFMKQAGAAVGSIAGSYLDKKPPSTDGGDEEGGTTKTKETYSNEGRQLGTLIGGMF